MLDGRRLDYMQSASILTFFMQTSAQIALLATLTPTKTIVLIGHIALGAYLSRYLR